MTPIQFQLNFQMLAANTIRQVAEEENLSCKIGFFLHIPFPSYDIVKIFPWEDMIIQVTKIKLYYVDMVAVFDAVVVANVIVYC